MARRAPCQLIRKGGKEMFRKLDMLLISAKGKMERLADRMIHEEKGAADIVAILVVIVILIAVAGIFRTQLMELVTTVFEKVTDFGEQ